ncbi:MAG: 2-oxoacid:acceptor oxidoreductase family protein [Negativicutes bacterium]|nr:2-oxoacid:acceptor oxidoreductase family protein [Negativicutes bacterium]
MNEIRWHGRGGQGGFTAARLLGMAASFYPNYYVQAFPSFGPERRGAPVLGFTRIDTQPIFDHSMVYGCDYVVVLDESLLETVDVRKGLRPGGILLINSSHEPEHFMTAHDFGLYTIGATGIATEILGQVVVNTAMFGALIAVSGLVSLEAALRAVELTLPQKIWDKNKKVVEIAYNQLRGAKSC